MKRILFFRHWQLFLLLIICGSWTAPSPFGEIINGIALLTYIFWTYSVGVYGQKRIVELGLKPMNVKLFKLNVLALGSIFFVGLIYYGADSNGDNFSNTNNAFEPKYVFFVLISLYGLFSICHTIYFTSKTIAKVEFRREVSLSAYFGNLLMVTFFLIGVWIIQPKVNRLIA